MTFDVLVGDAREQLAVLEERSVQCVVTSPPYWGQRDYETEDVQWGDGWVGSLGREPTPEQFVTHIVEVFRHVHRVLRDDGTLWLVVGDCYASSPPGNETLGVSLKSTLAGAKSQRYRETLSKSVQTKRSTLAPGLKPKDLVGIPWMVAFALRADGWYLRNEIIWAKAHEFCSGGVGSTMPESVRDRLTRAHEQMFLLTKSPRYYWDKEAATRAGVYPAGTRAAKGSGEREGNRRKAEYAIYNGRRNLRDVWFVSAKPFKGAHCATYPPELIRPCIEIGSRPGDVVLDPFCGSGTTGLVATKLKRRFIGVELNPEYVPDAVDRIRGGTVA